PLSTAASPYTTLFRSPDRRDRRHRGQPAAERARRNPALGAAAAAAEGLVLRAAGDEPGRAARELGLARAGARGRPASGPLVGRLDRKSTRLNSSHSQI